MNSRILFNKKLMFNSIKYCVLFLYSMIIVCPLLFLMISSFKSSDEIFTNPFSLPHSFSFNIYLEVLIKNKLILNIYNSLVLACSTVVLSAVICVMAGYAITRMKWKLSGLVMILLLSGLVFPGQGILVPLFIATQKLGIRNPRLILIPLFTALALPRTIFIVSSFLKDISISLEESALIDGAGFFQILTRIITPLLKPAIATVSIFNFLMVWNDLLFSMVFIARPSDATMQLGILKFRDQYITRYNESVTAVLLAVIPTMLMYVFLQKKIISGISTGSIKY